LVRVQIIDKLQGTTERKQEQSEWFRVERIFNKTRNARINVTMGRVRATIVTVEKQLVLHFMSVYL